MIRHFCSPVVLAAKVLRISARRTARAVLNQQGAPLTHVSSVRPVSSSAQIQRTEESPHVTVKNLIEQINRVESWHKKKHDLADAKQEMEPPPPPLCVQNLTEEMKNEIAPDTIQRIRLETVIQEITRMSLKQKDNIHWTNLKSFRDQRSRNKYVAALVQGKDVLEQMEALQEEDTQYEQGFQLDQEVIDRVTGGDQRLLQELSEFRLEYDNYAMYGKILPTTLPEHKLRSLLIDLKNGRVKPMSFLSYLEKTELCAMSEILKKAVANATKVFQHKMPDDHIGYSLGSNTIYHRFYPRNMKMQQNWKAIREFVPGLEGQPVILDFQFVSTMTEKNRSRDVVHTMNLYREVLTCMSDNSTAHSPSALYCCNIDERQHETQTFLKMMSEDDYRTPAVVTEKHYLEMFPRDRLVYLSPNSKEDLVYDPDDIYIIGVLHGNMSTPLTLGQAKKEGIRHARLPLRDALRFHQELTVNSCSAIISDYRFSKDWNYACRWVPPRAFKAQVQSSRNGYLGDYIARRVLSPQNDASNALMYPSEYNRRYKELIEAYKEITGKTRQMSKSYERFRDNFSSMRKTRPRKRREIYY